MIKIWLLIFVFMPCVINAQNIRDLKDGKVISDSSYIYALPFEKGQSYLLVQGYNSRLSHRGEIALDFKMRTGTPICAMRSGKVIETKEDANARGLKTKYYSQANYILIQHDDNSYAWYFHLKQHGVLVQVGDQVEEGQVIGLSGNTGYSFFPHLHVEVVVQESSRWKQIPMRFALRNGPKYLRPGHYYRNGEKAKT